MSDKDLGGPAFPKWIDGNRPISAKSQDAGMTLLDYFAAACIHSQFDMAVAAHEMDDEIPILETAARGAYALADAMLKERAK